MMELDAAIHLLRKIVNDSHLDNQKRIDFSLVNAHEIPVYEEAMKCVKVAVINGEISQEDLNTRLGLN